MFRFRLAFVIVVSFGFVLFLGIALYWSSNQVALYVQRSQIAYERLDHYERLSQEAYRHFKQRMDRLMTATPMAKAGVELSRDGLYDAIQKLRETAVTASIPETDNAQLQNNQLAELERVARFSAFLDAIEYRFDEVEQLRQQGQYDAAVKVLTKFSKEEIDEKFQPLIDDAINAEREKATKAKQELEDWITRSRWIAILASLTAAIFSLISGFLLLRGIRKPIEVLMKGTTEIASGHLDYRITLDTRDEFAYLGSHFNQMAQELQLQQDKLREGRVVLEKRVVERTFELHRLNEELSHMDNTRREFLADISHELRTPITVIRGEAEVTLRGRNRDAEEYKDTLERIVELSMQLGKYVNDLLFLARTETTNLQFEWDDRLDLTELLASTVENFQVMAEENAISVSLDAPAEPVWVRGDKQRLRQLLFILGNNACQYSKPGGHITVTLWIDENEVNFSLADQGIGIPTEDLERIFDRQFRSQNAQISREEGRGLGLPMAKSIMKAHGGRIAVTSIENRGSTFTATLPLILEGQDEADK
jgi:signal transduction histidine kinase